MKSYVSKVTFHLCGITKKKTKHFQDAWGARCSKTQPEKNLLFLSTSCGDQHLLILLQQYSSSLSLLTSISSVGCSCEILLNCPKTCRQVSFHTEFTPHDFLVLISLWFHHAEVPANILSIYRTSVKVSARAREATRHILGTLRFKDIPRYLSANLWAPLSIFIGAGRPWAASCWRRPRRKGLLVWAERWWEWRYKCLLGHSPPPCSRSHIWKNRQWSRVETI